MSLHIGSPRLGNMISASPGRRDLPELQVIFEGLYACVAVEDRLEFRIEKIAAKGPQVLRKVVTDSIPFCLQDKPKYTRLRVIKRLRSFKYVLHRKWRTFQTGCIQQIGAVIQHIETSDPGDTVSTFRRNAILVGELFRISPRVRDSVKIVRIIEVARRQIRIRKVLLQILKPTSLGKFRRKHRVVPNEVVRYRTRDKSGFEFFVFYAERNILELYANAGFRGKIRSQLLGNIGPLA